jgi:hypothetical protein
MRGNEEADRVIPTPNACEANEVVSGPALVQAVVIAA